jgi:hypothetical protein
MIYGPNDTKNMNTEEGKYRYDWILKQRIKQASNWTPRPVSPARYVNLCETFLKHINLPKNALTLSA